MRIRNIIHKGLRRLVEDDDPSGVQPALAMKLRAMVSFLQDMSSENEVRSIAAWKAHRLTGARKGIWSLHVSRNWRLTFRVDGEALEIIDLDYEDYH